MALEGTPSTGGTSTSSTSTEEEEDTTSGDTSSTPTSGQTDGNLDAPDTTEPIQDDTTDSGDTPTATPGSGGEVDAPEDPIEDTSGDDTGGETPPGTPGEGGEADAPDTGDDFDDGDQQTTPDTGGTTDAPGTDTDPSDPGGDPRDEPQGPQREDFDTAGDFVEASAEDAFPNIGGGEIFSTRSGNRIEARFTERGARRAAASLAGTGVNPDDIQFDEDPVGGFTIDDIADALQSERTDLRQQFQAFEGEQANLREDIVSEAQIEAGIEARAEAQRRLDEMQGDFERGNLGDPNEIRAEQAAEQVSEELGFEVTDEDITVRDAEGDSFDVELSSEQAQRAAALTTSGDFFKRDVEVTRTESGDFDVELPGDTPAVEKALERKIETGEAFGGDTSVNLFGHTLKIEEDLENVADAVDRRSEQAADVVDEANLFRPGASTNVGGDDDQQFIGSPSVGEASEDLLVKTGQEFVSLAGEAPSDLLEAGEAATDPTFYKAIEEIDSEIGDVRQYDAADVQASLEGTVETAERLDEAAQENPKVAGEVGATLLGAGALTAGTLAAAPAAVSGLSRVSPTAGRAATVALDPVRTTAKSSARVTSRATAGVGRRLPTPDLSDTRRAISESTPDVSVVRDPEAGIVDVDPAARAELRDTLSISTPSRQRVQSDLSRRIGAARQRANVELANAQIGARAVGQRASDLSVGDAAKASERAVEGARDAVTGTTKGAAVSANVAAFNARRRLADIDAEDVLPDRPLLGSEDDLVDPVRGAAFGTTASVEARARRLANLDTDNLVPDLPDFRSTGLMNRREAAAGSLNVNAELAARRLTSFDPADMAPSRPFIGSEDDLIGPFRGTALGAGASAEAQARRLANIDAGDFLPDTDSLRGLSDLTLRVEPSRPPRTPMTRTLDMDDADLTADETEVFDAFDDVSGGGSTTSTDARIVGTTTDNDIEDVGQVAVTRARSESTTSELDTDATTGRPLGVSEVDFSDTTLPDSELTPGTDDDLVPDESDMDIAGVGESQFFDVGGEVEETTDDLTTDINEISAVTETPGLTQGGGIGTDLFEPVDSTTIQETVTVQESESEPPTKRPPRKPPEIPSLPDFNEGKPPEVAAGDDGRSKVFENPSISPEEALGFTPTDAGSDDSSDTIDADLDELTDFDLGD